MTEIIKPVSPTDIAEKWNKVVIAKESGNLESVEKAMEALSLKLANAKDISVIRKLQEEATK